MSSTTPHRTWRAPLLLAALSVLGLMSALLGDGVWDALSWLALGMPLVAIGWHCCRPASPPTQD